MQPDSDTNKTTRGASFKLGQLFITPGAREALEIAGQTEMEFLRRHIGGDWGEITEGDIQENKLSLLKGFRVLSSHRTAKGQILWIITEGDRSATTLLLPSEY
jgi:hypothetical protein